MVDSKKDSGKDEKTREFLRLFIENQRRIYALIAMMVPCQADVEDLMQETSSVMWSKFDTFKPGSNFVAWGMRIAHILVLKYYNQNKKYQEFKEVISHHLVQQSPDVLDQMNYRIENLQNCFEKLKVEDRKLIKMRYEQGKEVKTISKILSTSSRTLYRSLARIHGLLFECIRRSSVMDRGV